MKYLFLMLILASCSTEQPRGSSTWDVDFTFLNSDKEIHAFCVKGEPIYPRIQVNTNWETGKQWAQYVWQCPSDPNHGSVDYMFLGDNGK